MERLQPRVAVAVPVSAIVLAAGAAASFGVGNAFGFICDASEDVSAVIWLLGVVPASGSTAEAGHLGQEIGWSSS